MNKDTGIYKITCLSTTECYIGSTNTIRKRWRNHKYLLNKDQHHSRKLQRVWNQYGMDNFEFSIVENCSVEVLLIREQYYIMLHRPKYNVSLLAGSRAGVSCSELTKSRISVSNKKAFAGKVSPYKGVPRSEETKRKIGDVNRGKKFSQELCEKMSQAQSGEKNHFYGKTHSEETKSKISNAIKLRALAKGITKSVVEVKKERKHSEESKRKMSETQKRICNEPERIKQASERMKGFKHSPETKAKLTEQRMGKSPSLETREKLSQVMRGRTFSEESRLKLSEASKRRVRDGMGRLR